MGKLTGAKTGAAIFHAPGEPGVRRVEVQVHQGDTVATADSVVTVTEALLATFRQTTVPVRDCPATASNVPPASPGDRGSTRPAT